MHIYLSKSNNADPILYKAVKYALNQDGWMVHEYSSSKSQNSESLKNAFALVAVLPRGYIVESVTKWGNVIGRGQYLQIEEFLESHDFTSVICIGDLDSNPYTLTSNDCTDLLLESHDWNNYCRLFTKESQNNLFEIIENLIPKNNTKMNTTTNNSLKNRIMSQFMPQIADDLGISMDGNICIFKGDDAIAINSNNELINYPKEMAIKCGLYLINKPLRDVKAGDIIKVNGTYSKVLEVKPDLKQFRGLTYTGYKTTKVTATDGLLNMNNVQVVLNVFGDSISGMNPLMMMMLMDKEEDNSSMSKLLPFMMMSQQQGGQNMFGNMNPMMLMMLMGKDDIDPMMLMMMGGGFGGNAFMNTTTSQVEATPNNTPKRRTPKKKIEGDITED